MSTAAIRIRDAAVRERTGAARACRRCVLDGANRIELLARDSNGLYIDFAATVWAGSAEMSGRLVDENAQPIPSRRSAAEMAHHQLA